MRPQLVALDVDDTLLESDLSISRECADALRQAAALGVRIVLASGRMFRSALPFARHLDLTGYLIAYNGALIRSVEDRTIWHKPVPVGFARSLVDAAAREGLCLNLYIDDELIVERMDERVRYYMHIAGVSPRVVGDLKRVLDLGVPTKCLLVGDEAEISHLIPRLRREFPDLQISGSKARFIEVTRLGVRKEVALAEVARLYRVPVEAVMAVGDGENDAGMLRWAGFGVAVQNAGAGAREAADTIVQGARGAGVSEAIHRYVL